MIELQESLSCFCSFVWFEGSVFEIVFIIHIVGYSRTALKEYEQGHMSTVHAQLILLSIGPWCCREVFGWPQSLWYAKIFWSLADLSYCKEGKFLNLMSNSIKRCRNLHSEFVPHVGHVTVWKTLNGSRSVMTLLFIDTRIHSKGYQ